MFAYVLMTHGPKPKPKPKSSLSKHPAARQQIANLRYHLGGKVEKFSVQYEYVRNVVGLASLPALKNFLDKMIKLPKGGLVVDDLARLFRACRPEHRAQLAEELAPYGEVLFGLRQKNLLSELTGVQRAIVEKGLQDGPYVLARSPRRGRSAESLRLQTEDAVLASSMARRSAADAKAKELAAVRAELKTTNARVTNVMIAEEANRRNIQTTRGGNWRSDTVARSLKRLERPTLAEKAKRRRSRKLNTA